MQPSEVRVGDVGFATDLDHLGPWSFRQFQWDATDGTCVVGDVVTLDSVSSRQALGQHSILVDQRQRNPVDLVLEGVFELFVLAKQSADPGVEFGQFFVGECILNREHWQPVRDGFEPGDRFTAHLV